MRILEIPYIKGGLMGGIASLLLLASLYLNGPASFISSYGFFHLLIAVLFSAVAIAIAKMPTGLITFKRAFANGFFAFMIAVIIYLVAYTTIVHSDEAVSKALIEKNTEMLRKNHFPENKISEEAKDFGHHPILDVLSITALMSVIGFLSSVTLGSVFKNEKPYAQN